MTIKEWQELAHKLAKTKGWWNDKETGARIEARNVVGEKIALIHSEASEALEDYRNGHSLTEVWKDEKGKPCGVGVEMADIVIRVMDFCGAAGIDLERMIELKHEYNATRPERHGGKVC